MVMSIDKTDQEIINLLLENSRQSFRQIAKKAGVSIATVLKRVKKLENEKIIRGYTVSLDYDALGYDLKALVDVRVSKGKLYEVESKIAKHPNVSAVYDITGAFDSVVVTRFKSMKLFDSFIKTIQTQPFIERTETKFILRIVKEQPLRI